MKGRGGKSRAVRLRGFPPRDLSGVLLLASRGIHPFHKYFLIVCPVPGTLLGTGEGMGNGVDLLSPSPHRAYVLVREEGHKQGGKAAFKLILENEAEEWYGK